MKVGDVVNVVGGELAGHRGEITEVLSEPDQWGEGQYNVLILSGRGEVYPHFESELRPT